MCRTQGVEGASATYCRHGEVERCVCGDAGLLEKRKTSTAPSLMFRDLMLIFLTFIHWQFIYYTTYFAIIADWHAVVRNNIERSYTPIIPHGNILQNYQPVDTGIAKHRIFPAPQGFSPCCPCVATPTPTCRAHPLLNLWQPPICYLFSIAIVLSFHECYVYRIVQPGTLWGCLFSVSLIPWGFIQVMECTHGSFVSFYY